MKKKIYILLLLTIGLFGLWLYLRYALRPEVILGRYASRIEKRLNKDYADLVQTIDDSLATFIRKGGVGAKSQAHFNTLLGLYEKPYSIYVYHHDSLVLWTNSKLYPPESLPDGPPRHQSFVKLKNAHAYLVRRPVPGTKSYSVIGLIPIKYDYQFPKLKKSNVFAADPSIPSDIQLSRNPGGSIAVRGPNGDKLYLHVNETWKDALSSQYLLYILGLAFVFFLLLVNQIAQLIAARRPKQAAIFLLSLVTFLSLVFFIWDPFPKIVRTGTLAKALSLPLFHTSLGVVLFFSFSFLWLMTHLNRSFTFKDNISLPKWLKFVIAITLNIALIFGIAFVLEIYREIINSGMLEVSLLSMLEKRTSSVLGLGVILMALTGLVFYALWIIKFIAKLGLRKIERVTGILAAFMIVTTSLYISQSPIGSPILIGSAILIPSILDVYVQTRNQKAPFQIFMWIAFMAGLASVSLMYFERQKDYAEMQQYAELLSNERDTLAEQALLALAPHIRTDPFWDTIAGGYPITYDYPGTKLMVAAHLDNIQNLENDYEYNIFLFDTNKKSLYDKGDLFIEQSMSLPDYHFYRRNARKVPGIDGLFLYNNLIDGSYSYYLELPVKLKKRIPALFVLEAKSKIGGKKAINSPIFSSGASSDRLKHLGRYEYAVFRNHTCIRNKGRLKNKFITLDKPQSPATGYFTDDSDFVYYVYKGKTGNIVIIGEPVEFFPELVSLFAMLFFLISFLTGIASLINKRIKFLPGFLDMELLSGKTFYARMQSGFLILLYITFIALGIFTSTFFHRRTKEYHDGRLSRKTHTIMKDLRYILSDRPSYPSIKKIQTTIKDNLEQLSDVHGMDVINFFGPDGHLIGSTKEELFHNGTIPPLMNSIAFSQLKENKLNEIKLHEQIGKVKYRVSYLPVYYGRKLTGYLGIPYYTNQRKQLKEVNEFISKLLIGYIALFFMGLAIIILGTRKLFKPFQVLSKGIRSGEPIDWPNEDEFKAFVNAYNESLIEKEKQHKLKVKIEKEMAWRDMAKQIAHDIKTPITPLQLHLQNLEEKLDNGTIPDGPLKKSIKKVIDVITDRNRQLLNELDKFRDFANKDQSEQIKEEIILNDLLLDIYHLFDSTENVNLEIHLPDEKVHILGDASQLKRVFNNLVNNAIQALTEAGTEDAFVRIALTFDNNVATVSIQDNGPGIPEAMKDKIFLPRFTTKSSGSGLGLYISKNIIEAHEGDLFFTTEAGRGTTFFIKLVIYRVISRL